MAKYDVKQTAVSQVLADVRSDNIAIPELQRPFVWGANLLFPNGVIGNPF